MRRLVCCGLLILCGTVARLPAAYAVSDDFSSDPLAGGSPWSFGLGSNANSQFSWSPGELTVHVDTSVPTARLDLPLGFSLDDDAHFVLSAQFRFHVESAPTFQFSQFAFGLTNSALTGGDRTGMPGNFDSANTYHTVEFNYYPNVSPPFGATLSPAVFGGQPPTLNAFHNFAAIFESASDLGDNTTGVTALPQDTLLEAQLAYDGGAKTVTLTMYEVESDNSLSFVETELIPLDLQGVNSAYDQANGFVLDSISLMAYFDAFTTADNPSLVGDITFDSVSLVVVPEPSALALSLAGAAAALGLARRRARRTRTLASAAASGGPVVPPAVC
jgi:hypothetical protein